MTAEEWEAVRVLHGGKDRVVTTEDGRVLRWSWKAAGIPVRARLWTIVGGGIPWVKFDNADINQILGREWSEEMNRRKAKVANRRGNKKSSVEPTKL